MAIQLKAIKQCFPAVMFVLLFSVAVVSPFKPKLYIVLSYGTIWTEYELRGKSYSVRALGLIWYIEHHTAYSYFYTLLLTETG